MQTQTAAHERRHASAWIHARDWRLPIILVCLGILLFAYARLYQACSSALETCDFFAYYNAALSVRHGIDPFAPVAAWIYTYQPGQPFVASYYVYAPFFALLVAPFTFLPFREAFLLWSLCNGVMLYGSVALLVRTAGVRLAQFQVLLLTLCASLLSMVRLEYNWGQADIFVLFFVCAAFYARQREHSVIAGLLLALACVTKPPLLLFVPFLLWKREFRYAAATTIAFLTMLFMPFLWLGRQAFSDQLLIWQFWSNQYVSFIDNNSPKGVLARLLTINPNVRPLIVAPAVMTILWLAIVVVVSICVLAVITPTPLRRDVYSLMEIGLIILAMFLISPLTEYIYLTLLIVPLCSIYLFAYGPSNNHPHHARRALSLATIVGWLLLCLPLQRIEYFFWPRMQTPSPLAYLYVLLAAVYLYVSVAFFVLQLTALSLALDRPFRASLRRLLAISLRNRMMHTPQDIGADVPEHQTGQETDHTNTGRRSPIRVLLMTNSVAIGGMEKHVEMLARDLSRDAADVYAICPRWEEIAPWAATLAQSVDDAQHFAQITPDRRYGRLSLLKETLQLWQQLRRWRIQVMHLHLTTYEGGVWTLLAARLAGVRAIFCTEHLAPEHPLPRMRKLRRDLITRSLTGIVCVSLKNRQAREQHLYTPPHKTTVVNNGVDLDNFPPTPPQEIADLRAQLGIPSNAS
ncbi:MAG TPA: glycosyltransferase 87 family protein, partial [Ktedonobacterales bacterium]